MNACGMTHLVHHMSEKLTRELEAAGFRIVHTGGTYGNGKPPPPSKPMTQKERERFRAFIAPRCPRCNEVLTQSPSGDRWCPECREEPNDES